MEADGITAEIIMETGRLMKEILFKVFNQILKSCKIPSDWKSMIVIPIHERNDKLNPANYLAISLLFILGKVFNAIILD